ncbi:glycosyltransferase family 2 protein [Ancylobacter radicis]|uniref:Glycosyltransferase family 2 protein n=1 Tax=Ancylobacter radicis TaxID=2836179 RepID=A0ABS5R4N5_9HYPH|nr:glycosyltransferase family 2 protein [Ancylobacter radicis]MBS9476591.1 glycosyltransferase family 2 protein [Ancylobacter radicis]
MRVASISLVKNEADIIECFVRHNLAFVDKMFIIDDRSSDATPEILRLLRDEFPNLEIIDDQWRGGIAQGQRTTWLLQHALKEQDWDIVTALDADEFIAATSRQEFEEDLAAIPYGMAGGFFETCYVVSPDDDPAIVDPLERLHAQIDRNAPVPFKAIVTRALSRNGNVSYDPGNHGVCFEGKSVAVWPLPRVRLAHFPIRSAEHAVVKALTHYVGWKSCHRFTPDLALHVMRCIDILKRQPEFSIAQREELIAQFIPEMAVCARVERRFLERRGTMKWPELAQRQPFALVVGLLDELIGRVTFGDQLALIGSTGWSESDRLRTLMAEHHALQNELTDLRRSRSKLAAAFAQVLRDKMARKFRKRRLRIQTFLARCRGAGG